MKRFVFPLFVFVLILSVSCTNHLLPPAGTDDVAAAGTVDTKITTSAPDTAGVPETAAPETKAPETTAKETTAPVTTAHEEAWTVVTPAGCRTAGSEERIVNGAIEQREIPLLGHDIAKDGYCTRCGERFSYGLCYERETFRADRESPYRFGRECSYLFRLYSENAPEYLCVSVGDCTDAELIIPDYIYGLPVRVLAESGFDQLEITSVLIPDTVLEIRAYCFDWCEKLETVIFPASSLQRIQQFAFANCTKYTEIELPDSVTSIFSGAFWLAYPERLEKQRRIVLPENLCAIGNNNFLLSAPLTFKNMSRSPFSSQKSVSYQTDGLFCDVSVYENGGYYIGSRTNPHFLLVAADEDLASFTAHPDTRIIGPYALAYSMEKVTLPEGLRTISGNAISAFWVTGYYPFEIEIRRLTSLSIPQTVKYIGVSALESQYMLSSVLLPASAETVADQIQRYGTLPEILYADGFHAETRDWCDDADADYKPGFDFSEKILGWQYRYRNWARGLTP